MFAIVILTLNLPSEDDRRAESLGYLLYFHVGQLPISSFPGNDITCRRESLVPQPAKKFLSAIVEQFVIHSFPFTPKHQIEHRDVLLLRLHRGDVVIYNSVKPLLA